MTNNGKMENYNQAAARVHAAFHRRFNRLRAEENQRTQELNVELARAGKPQIALKPLIKFKCAPARFY